MQSVDGPYKAVASGYKTCDPQAFEEQAATAAQMGRAEGASELAELKSSSAQLWE